MKPELRERLRELVEAAWSKNVRVKTKARSKEELRKDHDSETIVRWSREGRGLRLFW